MGEQRGPVLLKRRLGRRLRELRDQSTLSVTEAAERLEFSASKLNRIETGGQSVSVHEVRSMMDLYDVRDDELLEMARKTREKGWWTAYGVDNRGYIPLETDASMIRCYQVVLVPGLMQTADYARELFANGQTPQTCDWIDNQVALRMARKERLTQEHGLEFAVIVDESALRRLIGGHELMGAQLLHLAELAALPSVTFQVVPISPRPHLGLNGSFNLLSFPNAEIPDMGYVEYTGGSVHIEKPSEVNACRLAFDHLRSVALSPDDSVRLVGRIREEVAT